MKWPREGYTTGTCAAAAAKAATMLLCGGPAPSSIDVVLPDGMRISLPVAYVKVNEGRAEAAVRKDAGDDPDTTNGAMIAVRAEWTDSGDVTFRAGAGVGTVTKPGLSVPPGEPAINPVPRTMIADAVREVSDRSVEVTISIPGGRELAAKTFNPRLGIEGGLSILGTTGRVRPYSSSALRDALRCSLDVASACGIDAPVLVPGRIGGRAARKNFSLETEQVIEVVNEWGFMLDAAAKHAFSRLLVLGHPGKLAKLTEGHWDTHSSRSPSAVPVVVEIAEHVLGGKPEPQTTVEGIFNSLAEGCRRRLAAELAERVRQAVGGRVGEKQDVAVALINMSGELLGCAGNVEAWR